jgi:hypothetical protein
MMIFLCFEINWISAKVGGEWNIYILCSIFVCLIGVCLQVESYNWKVQTNFAMAVQYHWGAPVNAQSSVVLRD